ncbi:hypothetical protein [Peptostreptococcus porci]|uniref:hypothetical protein n=1 Tax=Peptostreptococcus porci TaxID=2652282 RepID=UPI002A820823|nr:hypothetical protein [Peptostreptococcus porci]MDY4128958.1 hypothetical protein [Peptostreptococcus porci]
MNLKCKKCGNGEDFYIKERYWGEITLHVYTNGDISEYNSDAYDNAQYKLKSIYYYCCNCDCRVAKIPESKRY